MAGTEGIKSLLQSWETQQSTQPAAPVGAAQVSTAAAAQQAGDPAYENNALASWFNGSENPYVDTARSWFTGANQYGTNNGWDTVFYNNFMDQQKDLGERGLLGEQFKRAEELRATGVVTWDHNRDGREAKGDGTDDFVFGDVYVDGKWVSNLYGQNKVHEETRDGIKYDKAAADLMMGQLVLDGDTQGRLFSSTEREAKIGQAVVDKRLSNLVEVPKLITAMEQQKEIKEKQEDLGFFGELGVVVGGVLSGAGIGAGAGATVGSWSGPGAIFSAAGGAIGGGAIGGIGAWLNRDELTEQMARAWVVTGDANEQFGFGGALTTGMKEWSAVAGKSMMPTTNLLHGGYDAMTGGMGDDESSWYAVNDKGDRVISKWLRGAEVVTGVTDSLAQFASPVGAALYTGQMSTAIAGSVGQLAVTGGYTYDDRRGEFDNIAYDDHGNLDPIAAAAGIASIGVDVVQLGMARGLGNVAASERKVAGLADDSAPGLFGRMREKLPTTPWSLSKNPEVKEVVEMSGYRYGLDAGGKAVARRKSMSLLAPSEMIQAASTRVHAMRVSARESGALSVDDLYQSARHLSAGSKPLTAAILNGWGEGTEEALQSVLEPLSHNGRVEFSEVGDSFLQGMAMGAGMTLGQRLQGSSQDSKMYAIAQQGYANMTGGSELTREEWRTMDEADKKRISAMSTMDSIVHQTAAQKLQDEAAIEQVATMPGVTRHRDAMLAGMTAGLDKSSSQGTDQGMVITAFEDVGRINPNTGERAPDSMPNHAVVSSGTQMMLNFSNHVDGLHIQIAHVKREIEQSIQRSQEARAAGDETIAVEQDELFTRLTATQSLLERAADLAQELGESLNSKVRGLYDAVRRGNLPKVKADVREINSLLRDAYDRKLDYLPTAEGTRLMSQEEKNALARAVTMIGSRYPQDNPGSYQALVPQISELLTREGRGGDNMLQVSQAVLTPLSGDYDGDKLFLQHRLFLDEDAFAEVRSGTGSFGATSGDARAEQAGETTEPEIVMGARAYDKALLQVFGRAISNNESPELRDFATSALDEIAHLVKQKFAPADAPSEVRFGVDRALKDFTDAMLVGSEDARMILLNSLNREIGDSMKEMGRRTWSKPFDWVDEVVQSAMQNFQESYAMWHPELVRSKTLIDTYVDPKTNRPVLEINTNEPVVRPSQSMVKQKFQEKAATLGATMNLVIAGDSLFRQFQALHYASLNSPVQRADGTMDHLTEMELAELYEAISQAMEQSEFERVTTTDSVHSRAWAFINQIAESAVRDPNNGLTKGDALAVVANLAVRDVVMNEDGTAATTGGEITVAQMALRMSVQVERRRNARVLDTNPTLETKYRALEAVTYPGGGGHNAERAFLEVVGHHSFYSLLGEQAGPLGQNLTPEQFVRRFGSMTEEQRQDERHRLMNSAPYLGRKETKNMPYHLSEMGSDDTTISGFRSVVDAMLTVGNVRSKDIASRSDAVSKNFSETFGFIRSAYDDFLKTNPRREDEHGPGAERAVFRRFMDANPQFSKALMELVPDNMAQAAFQTVNLPNGQVQLHIANWVHDMFLASTAEKAEVIYWRQLILGSWNAMRSQSEPSEDADSTRDIRNYDRLTNRVHQVIYELNHKGDSGALLALFQKQLGEAESVKDILQWINETPGVRGNRAPLVAWYNDVADFDPDMSQGGWGATGEGTVVRDALANLRTAAERMSIAQRDEAMLQQKDTGTLLTLESAAAKYRKGAKDPYKAMDQTERVLYEAFEKQLERAKGTSVSFGPTAMIHQLFGVINSFYGSAHTKGQNPVNFDPLGQFEMFRDAFGYNVNFERAMSALTSVDLSAVGQNPAQAIKDSLRSMTDDGRQVTWDTPSPADVIQLLKNPDTRGFARNLLFPQVMELTEANTLSMQSMFDRSISDLLDGNSYSQLFDPSVSSKLKYLSMVESEARGLSEDGNAFQVLNAVGDLVIARVSALTKPADLFTQQTMIIEAMTDMADALRVAGAATANRARLITPDGNTYLQEIKSQAYDALQRQMAGRELGFTEEEAKDPRGFRNLVDILIEGFNQQSIITSASLVEAGEVDAADQVKKDFEYLKSRIEAVAASSSFRTLSNQFTDVASDSYRQVAVAEYLMSHPEIIQKAPELARDMQEIEAAIREDFEPRDVDWDALGEKIVALVLESESVEAAPRVGVMSVPLGKTNERYWDKTFSYLLDPILDDDGPIARAAAKIHLTAGRDYDVPTIADALSIIQKSVYKEFSLGAWTSDIPILSIEARERTAASAAAKVISAAGDLTKRQGVISAATARTFRNPGDELLSSVKLSGLDLEKDLYADVAFNLNVQGQPVAGSMPLTQLNNRFAKSVLMRYLDDNGDEIVVDLMADDGGTLGYNWGPADGEVDKSGYRVISLTRLQSAFTRALDGVSGVATAPTLEVQFFHPDSTPPQEGWYNNIFFEGVSFETSGADAHVSLNASLFFGPGALNQMTQRGALDANKLGVSAMQIIQTAPAVTVAKIEAEWNVSLSDVISTKAVSMMQTDLGQGLLDPTFFNAVHKNMKLRHWVKGEVNGKAVLLSAEEVIAQQAAFMRDNPTHTGPIPLQSGGVELTKASLWIPTDSVLRTMLGEQGNKGAIVPLEELEHDLTKVPQYQGPDSGRILKNVERGFALTAADLRETRVMPASSLRVLSVREHMPAKQMTAYELQVKQWEGAAVRASSARSMMGIGTFDPSKNFKTAFDVLKNNLSAEDMKFRPLNEGAQILGVRDPREIQHSLDTVEALMATLEVDGTNRSGWVLRESGTSQPFAGLLTKAATTSDDTPGARPVYGDLVVLDLGSITDFKTGQQLVDYLTSRGVFIALSDSEGRTDLRSDLTTYIRQQANYDRVGGSKHLYGPFSQSPRFQNARARTSTWVTVGQMSMADRLLTFLTEGTPMDENSAWAVHTEGVMQQRIRTSAMIPVNYLSDYNIPVDDGSADSQASQVHRHLLSTLADPDKRLALMDMGGKEPKRSKLLKGVTDPVMSLEKALERLENRLTSGGGLLPEPGQELLPGDIIPMVNQAGRIVLYRHGFKAPDNRAAVRAMQDTEVNSEPLQIAVYRSEVEEAASSYSGRVQEYRPRPGRGIDVLQDVPLSVFGDKKVYEFNGMKYVVTPFPGNESQPLYALPEHGVFNNRGIDVIADMKSALSKQSFGDTLNNHSTAFAVFGIDFLPDVTEVFFPGKGADAAAQTQTRELLYAIQNSGTHLPVATALELIRGTQPRRELGGLLRERAGSTGMSQEVLDNLLSGFENRAVEGNIAYAMIAYLMTDGAQVENVLVSAGLHGNIGSSAAQTSLVMPQLFTQVFDIAPVDSPLRMAINKRLNDQLNNDPNSKGGYVLHPDFTFEILGPNGTSMEGFLQVPKVYSSGDNPVLDENAYNPNASQGLSAHVASVAYQTVGAQTTFDKDQSNKRSSLLGKNVVRFQSEAEGGKANQLWDMLSDIPKEDKTFQPWQRLTAGELARMGESRRAMIEFRQPITKTIGTGPGQWTEGQVSNYETRARGILSAYGLDTRMTDYVDFWVRQFIGEAKGFSESGKPYGFDINPDAAAQALEQIEWNASQGHLPTFAALVPMIHLHDMQAIFLANAKAGAPKFRLRRGRDKELGYALTKGDAGFTQWTQIALGTSLLESQTDFDPVFLLATDGFMHTHMNGNRDLMDVPVSQNSLLSLSLMDPDVDKALAVLSEPSDQLLVTLDPVLRESLKDPVMVETARKSLQSYIDGTSRQDGTVAGGRMTSAVVAQRLEHIAKWRKQNGMPLVIPTSSADFIKTGATYVDKSTNTNSLFRILINLRAGTTLINPALMTTAVMELIIRGSLEKAADLLTWESSSGRLARRQARKTEERQAKAMLRFDGKRELLQEKIIKAEREVDKNRLIQQLAQMEQMNDVKGGAFSLSKVFGRESSYSLADLDALQSLSNGLAQSSDFKGMLYDEMLFIQQKQGAGRFERGTEKLAKIGGRMQDPTWGMSQASLARRYMDAVFRHIETTPGYMAITYQQLVAKMRTNPMFIRDTMPEAHKAALNNIAQYRSLKQTVLSQMLRGIYEPLSNNGNGLANFTGFMLKVPLMFSAFSTNVALTLTGMHGINDLYAMHKHGRKKSGLMFGFQKALAGQKADEVSDTYDMSAVLEGMDLSRAFMRGALTHTGIFAYGLLNGGLGFGGEDDESKRRRRAAELQGAAFVYDPRKLENDFRNKDAIFLDNLPFGLDNLAMSLFQVGEGEDKRAMGFMPWTMKQFFSPLIGFEKFYQTGDWSHITHGYAEAIGSMPLVNIDQFQETMRTVDELAGLASDASKNSDRASQSSVFNYLIRGVGLYESMLFESSALNSWYVGMDRYDRAPYVTPLRDSDGDIQRDIYGNPRENNMALTSYSEEVVDPETGKMTTVVKYGYAGENPDATLLKSFTEKRLTLALATTAMSKLFGGESYMRQDMPIKTRDIEKAPLSYDEAKALVQMAFNAPGGGAQNLTMKEAGYAIKAKLKEQGIWYNGEEDIANRSSQWVSALEQGGEGFATSSITESIAPEVIQSSRIAEALRLLGAGKAKFGDDNLKSLFIPFAVREKLESDMTKQLVQEGVDLGLTNEGAYWRMKRIWDGTKDGSVEGYGVGEKSPGMRDILWSKDLSFSDKIVYNQLNSPVVMGPDGNPYATGARRDGLFQRLGLFIPNAAWSPADTGGTSGMDERLNVLDKGAMLNTGLRALEPTDPTWNVPTDKEMNDSLQKALEAAKGAQTTPVSAADGNSSGNGWRNFGGYGRRGGYSSRRGSGYSGGGGGYFSFSPTYFTRMYSLPERQAVYSDNIPFLNTSNPIIRRASIRRERFSSQRGRLNQWQ